MLVGMKRLLLPLLLCTSASALAAPPEFTYKGLPWYSSPAQATAYLKSRNWDEVKLNQPGVGLYRQREGGEGMSCQLVTNYKAARLDGVVRVCTFDPMLLADTVALYRSERDTLIQKLGRPLASRDSLQDGMPGAAWNRPGGSFVFGINEENSSALLWAYLAPSRKADFMAGLAKLR